MRPLDLEDHLLALQRWDAAEQAIKDKIHALLQERSEPDHVTGCWIYTGAWEPSGQAKIRVGSRVYSVQRVSAWLYLVGFDLWDLRRSVHSCPTPACFNPDHLLIVTDQREGLAVQTRLERRGKYPGHLHYADVRLLRTLAASGAPAEDLSRRFGIGLDRLLRILAGLTYGSVQ